MEAIRVLLVEDDPTWTKGLTCYLAKQHDICVVGETVSGQEAVQLAGQLDPDIVLMDILLGNQLDGLEATMQISRSGRSKVILLTSLEEDVIIFDAFKAGAVDYVVKTNFEEIPDAIRAAYQNRSPIRPCVADKIRREFCRLKEIERQYEVDRLKSIITPTERTILELIDKGCSQTEIARTLVISIRTVKVHVGNILKKFGGKSSREVAQRAKEMGII